MAKTWKEISDEVRTKFHLDPVPVELSKTRGLDYADKEKEEFSIHHEIEKLLKIESKEIFRLQDVEPLLDQASVILDRALADRTAWQSVGEKKAGLKLDLLYAIELDDIIRTERDAGKFEVDSKVSNATRDALTKRSDALKKVIENKQKSYDSYHPEAPLVVGSLARVHAMYSGTAESGIKKEIHPSFVQYVQGTPGVDVDEALSSWLYLMEHNIQWQSALADLEEAKGEKSAEEHEKTAIDAQCDWNTNNKNFQSKRADAVTSTLQMKVALTVAGKLLDFETQMRVIRTRYQEQVVDGYRRLQQAAQGLRRIYNYGSDLPDLTNEDSSFDQILAWTRHTTAWLAGFMRRCHNYVMPISIAMIATKGAAEGEWSFSLEKAHFPRQSFVRIRGICAWSVGKLGPYTLDITPPKDTQFLWAEGATSSLLKQDVKPCRLGRVLWREGGMPPEISGLTSLFNASPIGPWKVVASNPAAKDLDLPQDFHIDLYLSAVTEGP